MTLYKLNTDVIEYTRPTGIYSYTGTHHQQIDHLVELGILVPVEEKKCCDKCVMFTNGYCDKCHSPKDNPATTVAKFVDFLDKETLNPYDVRVEPTTDKEEWGEADFQALFAGYYSSQNKIREFIHRAEKEAVQKSRKDWLREEIERLEGMKDYDINNTNFDAGSNTLNEVHNEGYHFALQTIQDHYQKELNQK